MGFYDRHILPRLIDLAMRSRVLDRHRRQAIALARVALGRLSFAPSIEHSLTAQTIMLLKDDCVAAFDRAHDRVLRLTLQNLAKQGLLPEQRKRISRERNREK